MLNYLNLFSVMTIDTTNTIIGLTVEYSATPKNLKKLQLRDYAGNAQT